MPSNCEVCFALKILNKFGNEISVVENFVYFPQMKDVNFAKLVNWKMSNIGEAFRGPLVENAISPKVF